MAGLITSSKDYKLESAENRPRTSSVDAYFSDPDLLIREYFLSSSAKRAKSRQTIIERINSFPMSILAVLRWGAGGKTHDSYDGAINLLAETNSISLLESLSVTARKFIPMLENPSYRDFTETCLEILIKAIACAYKVDPIQRYRLIFDVIPPTNRRTIKASVIDALLIIADEIDVNTIKNAVERYTFDKDQYICDYAKEALQELNLDLF
ncbi:hypothetical protein VB774_10350 [Pseudanabaena galeata UHCC 0370]|uniref:Uncharacterized protein n=1 Tax=Pseudanabaena galeata UHCC 0370 TaxID=3110310 RepID=A0ABU5TID8_9CYAN|nr:hypothetical protein [Pseudanabaena galeata]MEA5478019.1 hypothetical protein [Pseudanabaena galeata UHCC 0370]